MHSIPQTLEQNASVPIREIEDWVEPSRAISAELTPRQEQIDSLRRGMIEWFNPERGYLVDISRLATGSELFINEPLPVSGSTCSPTLPIWEPLIEGVSFVYESPDRERLEGIRQRLAVIFRKAEEQVFEDGMESDFSKELVALIESHGNVAVSVLGDLILGEAVNAEAASEALRWLGHIEHPITHRSRLQLLEQSLSCLSARVRDGAALGLSFLDDPGAIPSLRRAIQQESCPELRDDLEQVLKQLEDLE